MIERNALYHVPFYKKTDFTGSYMGMHYKLGKVTIEQEVDGSPTQSTLLKATVWPGPFCYDATPDEKKESEAFEFSNDGITAACDWLNRKYSEKEDLYKTCHI